MKQQNNLVKNISIDCKNQSLGRISTQVATLLTGKNLPQYRDNIDFQVTVTLENWREVIFTGKKMKSKVFFSHSGFLGGLKSKTLEELWRDDPKSVIQHSIEGMLPKNKLQANRIKRLKFVGEK